MTDTKKVVSAIVGITVLWLLIKTITVEVTNQKGYEYMNSWPRSEPPEMEKAPFKSHMKKKMLRKRKVY